MSEGKIVKIFHGVPFNGFTQFGRAFLLGQAKSLMKQYKVSQEQWECFRIAFVESMNADYKNQSISFIGEGLGDEIIIAQNGHGTFNGKSGKFDITGLIKNAIRYRIPSMEEDYLMKV